MLSKLDTLLQTYGEYESKLSLQWIPESNNLGSLVTFTDNKQRPVDRWFHFKEGFSSGLLDYVLAHLPLDRSQVIRLLDPFAGVGTSVLAAQRAKNIGWVFEAVGVERNPFLEFVARTKLTWPLLDVDRLVQFEEQILSPPLSTSEFQGSIPKLTTINNPRVFSNRRLRHLLGLRERIKNCTSVHLRERDFLLLGYAAVLEQLSGVRKDGRALRFVERVDRPSVKKALVQQWRAMRADLVKLSEEKGVNHARMHLGDARSLRTLGLRDRSFDLILYSPPYLNNIDYTEVYKLETWMLEFITSYDEFRAQREKTIRSHPSIRFEPTDWLDKSDNVAAAKALREALVDVWPVECKDWRTRLVSGYMDDMLKCLQEQYRVAKDEAYVVCVVGNSLHLHKPYKVPVATDLLIAALAQSVGFEVEQMQAARHLHRRDGQRRHFLRESLIFMQKPMSKTGLEPRLCNRSIDSHSSSRS
jgi:DNA modification methylase